MNSTTIFEDLLQGKYNKGYWIWLILGPVFILVGGVGNILSLVVLNRKKMAKRVSSIFLGSLAAADLLLLVCGILPKLISIIIIHDVGALIPYGCQIGIVLTFFPRDMSSWIMVALNIERVYVTRYPLKYMKGRLTRTRQIIISIVCIVVLTFGANSFLFLMYDKVEMRHRNWTVIQTCQPDTLNYRRLWRAWSLIHILKSTVLPLAILCIGTVIIAKTLYQRRAKLQDMNASPATDRLFKIPTFTKLFLCINTVFVCTAAPIFIYVLTGAIQNVYRNMPMFVMMADPVMASLTFLSNLSLVTNFVVYCFTGSLFRKELKTLFQF